MISVTSPTLGEGEAPQATATQYDAYGWPRIITQPGLSTVANEYFPTGLLPLPYLQRKRIDHRLSFRRH